ncbi:MAG: IS66 family insertion sequence element accessory protein TnpB [Verrucomicrobiota bacterium]
MLSFAGSLKVWVALEPCDMRKGFNGLHALVSERLGEDLRAGALFVFSNRRHTRLKILYSLWVQCPGACSGFKGVREDKGWQAATSISSTTYRC